MVRAAHQVGAQRISLPTAGPSAPILPPGELWRGLGVLALAGADVPVSVSLALIGSKALAMVRGLLGSCWIFAYAEEDLEMPLLHHRKRSRRPRTLWAGAWLGTLTLAAGLASLAAPA